MRYYRDVGGRNWENGNTLTVTDMLFVLIWHSEFAGILFRDITFWKKKWCRTTFSESAVRESESGGELGQIAMILPPNFQYQKSLDKAIKMIPILNLWGQGIPAIECWTYTQLVSQASGQEWKFWQLKFRIKGYAKKKTATWGCFIWLRCSRTPLPQAFQKGNKLCVYAHDLVKLTSTISTRSCFKHRSHWTPTHQVSFAQYSGAQMKCNW